MLAAILTLLLGMVLGQRFKMFVLAPASLFVLILATGVCIARAETVWRIGVTAAGLVCCLQIGYLLGIAMLHLLIMARAKRQRVAPFSNSFRARHSAR